MKKMAFVDLCNFVDWPMGGMIVYELQILEILEQYYEMELWGVSVDGKKSPAIVINNRSYPVHIFADVKKKKRWIPNYWRGMQIRRLSESFLQYDIIYVHTGSCAVALAPVVKYRQSMLVYHQHGLQYLADHSLKTLLQKPFMDKAQKVADLSFVVTAQQEAEEYTKERKAYLKNRMVAIGSPIDGQEFDGETVAGKLKDKKEEKDYLFIYSGRLAPIKNVPSLIEIFAKFCGRGYEKSSLFIIGDGEEREAVCKKIRQYGLQKRVHMTGAVVPKKVKEYMMQADFYITASAGEGVSVAVLEAYAAGVPVVCFPVRGLRYQVQNGRTGVISRGMSQEDFADAMEDVIRNRQELSGNCLKESEKYQKEKIGRKIIEEIERRQKIPKT